MFDYLNFCLQFSVDSFVHVWLVSYPNHISLAGLTKAVNQYSMEPGPIARSVAISLGNQEAPRSILASGTSFREDLVMKLFLRPFFLFC